MSAKAHPPLGTIAVVELAVIAVFAFVGCSKAPKAVPTSPLAGQPRVSVPIAPTRSTPSTTTTPLTGEGAIISADEAWWDTFLAVASHSPVDPNDPELAKHAAGKQLASELTALNLLFTNHYHDVGTRTRTQYRVVQHVGNSAIVTSCDSDMVAVVENVGGKVAAPAPNSTSLVNHRLELVNGQWLVVDSGTQSKTC